MNNLSALLRLKRGNVNKVPKYFIVIYISFHSLSLFRRLILFFIYLELEAAQKAATDSQTAPPNPGLASSGDEDGVGASEPAVEKPAPTPDYAAGLLPTTSNPPATPLAAPATPLAPNVPTLTPLKASTRPPAPPISSVPPASPAAAQVVRLVAPPTAGTTISTPTVYRLVQPAVSAVPPTTVTTVTPVAQSTAPPKKSVALMLTVYFWKSIVFCRSLFILSFLNSESKCKKLRRCLRMRIK